MDKITIVSWFLTRRCNLRCMYCGIVRNYRGKPPEYPKMRHYSENEMTTEYIIEGLRRFKKHNPNAFHIFYGGEPFLRDDLPLIVGFCNDEDIHYTIITNNDERVQERIERLISEVGNVKGITSSIDPVICYAQSEGGHRLEKSIQGFKRLIELRAFINDVVAEITVDKFTLDFLYTLVKNLTEVQVNSDITFIDIAKSMYYDFSNVSDRGFLVPKTPRVLDIFKRIIEDGLDVHMARTLLPKIYEILPAELDCHIEKKVHNLSVDADGSVRLCLRIRGIETPKLKLDAYLFETGELSPFLKMNLKTDKGKYCRKCNWTCMLMSEIISKDEEKVKDLVHNERRTGHVEHIEHRE